MPSNFGGDQYDPDYNPDKPRVKNPKRLRRGETTIRVRKITRGNDSRVIELVGVRRPRFGPKHIDVTGSQVISRVYYDPRAEIMDAIFVNSGARYRYYTVTPRMFSKFVLAESMGRHFQKMIRPLPYKRLAKKAAMK